MAQIKKKFIGDNQVADEKIRLDNNSALRARNAANSADVEVIKVNASDNVEFPLQPYFGGSLLATESYVDTQISSQVSAVEWQESVLDILLTPPGSPATGDRYLINGTGAGGWAGQDNKIAEWDGSAWVYTTPTVGTVVGVDDETDGVYYFGGSSWSKKFFEATTASTGLVKVGVDIRLDASSAGDGLDFAAGVLSVNLEATDPSLQIVSDELGVKFSATSGLQKGAAGLSVKVNAATLKINGSGELEGLKPNKENLTLIAGDITNQYVDLEFEAAAESMIISVDGVMQYEGSDYSLSVVGGVTRVTFLGDLATGGASELIAGDILRVQYMYL